jgi:hypothetical protein
VGVGGYLGAAFHWKPQGLNVSGRARGQRRPGEHSSPGAPNPHPASVPRICDLRRTLSPRSFPSKMDIQAPTSRGQGKGNVDAAGKALRRRSSPSAHSRTAPGLGRALPAGGPAEQRVGGGEKPASAPIPAGRERIIAQKDSRTGTADQAAALCAARQRGVRATRSPGLERLPGGGVLSTAAGHWARTRDREVAWSL